MTMNWKNGAAWEAITTAALYGTYGGTCHVEWPPATSTDGNGAPCGAVGRPRIIIKTNWMTDTGMAFWRARFASSSSTYADFSIEVYDVRLGANTKYAGKLHWPTFASVGRGAAAGSTVYRGVEIVISDCTGTT